MQCEDIYKQHLLMFYQHKQPPITLTPPFNMSFLEVYAYHKKVCFRLSRLEYRTLFPIQDHNIRLSPPRPQAICLQDCLMLLGAIDPNLAIELNSDRAWRYSSSECTILFREWAWKELVMPQCVVYGRVVGPLRNIGVINKGTTGVYAHAAVMSNHSYGLQHQPHLGMSSPPLITPLPWKVK